MGVCVQSSIQLIDTDSEEHSERSHGRLGMTKLPRSIVPDMPFPAELRIPGVRIVSLIAGGMYASSTGLVLITADRNCDRDRSFHALGSKGELFVWGKSCDNQAFFLVN